MNDDGVRAPGLRVLAARLRDDDHEVEVVAPLDAHSGSGTSLGGELNGSFTALESVELLADRASPAIAVDGPPALAALAAAHGLIGRPPDLVISGINPGNNVGRLTLHSGTLAAAMTAAAYGWPAIAVSCAGAPHTHFEETADFVASRLDDLADAARNGAVLNVNYPPLEASEVRGVREATLAVSVSGDVRLEGSDTGFRATLDRSFDGAGTDSDLVLLGEGYITVTPLRVGYVHAEGGAVRVCD